MNLLVYSPLASSIIRETLNLINCVPDYRKDEIRVPDNMKRRKGRRFLVF